MSDKRELIKEKIIEFINHAVDNAADQDKLDYITINISNHNGQLQMDHQIRDRKKAY